MNRPLVADIEHALDGADEPLEAAAEVVRRAFEVDRVSLARIDADAGRFEISAEAGAALLAPGTALPLGTCSYFADAVEGGTFSESDFDASREFDRPVDSLVIASGFHAGCSVPLRRRGRALGALSLSSSARGRDMTTCTERLREAGAVLADRVERARPSAPPHVLVCHADALAARGIARLVELDAGARASLAPGVTEALRAATAAAPDVVVCDDFLDGRPVDAVAAALRDAGVVAPLLVVSSRDAPESLRAAVAAGAAGYVPRRDAVAGLAVALAAVHNGRTLLPEADEGGDRLLTPRERELLAGLEEGLRFKQLAQRLGISEATAKTHARNLFRKLDATSRAEAVHCARERGLIA